MRFSRIEATRFGPLAGLDSGEASELPGLVAVLGPNEAGKSAFHQLLIAMLYGFYPASRDQNPFSPWSGGNIDIRAVVELDGGQAMEVHRRLLTTPRARMIRNGEVETLNNRSIPPVLHIERRVYSEVYAITLAQLAGLREAAWETVQEQLIVGLGAQDLRSVRAAIRGFRDSAKRLWQPTKRGKQLHRELRSELAELGSQRGAAEERDRELRKVDEQLSGLRKRLDDLAKGREAKLGRLSMLRELLPLGARLQRLDELEARLEDREALAAAPRNPIEKDRELSERLGRSEERVRERMARLEAIAESARAFTPVESLINERSGSLRALISNAPLVHERMSRRENLSTEITALEGGIREAAIPLLGIRPSWEVVPAESDRSATDWDIVGKPFRTLEMAALREQVSEAEEARRRREVLEDRLESIAGRPGSRAPLISPPALLLVVAAIGVLFWGTFIAEPLVALVGVLLLLLGGSILARSWSSRTVVRQIRETALEEERSLRARIAEAEGEERLALASARKLLIPLGLQASHLDAPVAGLVTDLAELKHLFHQRYDRIVELGRLTEEDAVLDSEFERLVSDLEVPLPDDRGLALLELGRMIQQLDERRIRIEEAQAETNRLQAELEREREELRKVRELRQDFDGRLQTLGVSSDEAGLQELVRRLADLDMHERLRLELAEEVGGLDELRHRIEEAALGDARKKGDTDPIELEQEGLDAMEHEAQEIRERIGRLQERERALLKGDTLDLVDGQILVVRARLREVERDRDRSIVLARLVEKAETRFRDEHQPDLLRRAEDHLGVITGGRYERILVGKVDDQHGFYLDAEHLPEPSPVASPLSTGTREQVYLALRLAIVEHLDQESEPLPLLLDEVLVNWDPERRGRVLDLLSQLASERQTFVFTCHPHIADEVEARGGTLIRLGTS